MATKYWSVILLPILRTDRFQTIELARPLIKICFWICIIQFQNLLWNYYCLKLHWNSWSRNVYVLKKKSIQKYIFYAKKKTLLSRHACQLVQPWPPYASIDSWISSWVKWFISRGYHHCALVLHNFSQQFCYNIHMTACYVIVLARIRWNMVQTWHFIGLTICAGIGRLRTALNCHWFASFL